MPVFAMAFSIHPGEVLLTEFMEPLGLTAYRLARDLGISIPRVNDLVRAGDAMPRTSAARAILLQDIIPGNDG